MPDRHPSGSAGHASEPPTPISRRDFAALGGVAAIGALIPRPVAEGARRASATAPASDAGSARATAVLSVPDGVTDRPRVRRRNREGIDGQANARRRRVGRRVDAPAAGRDPRVALARDGGRMGVRGDRKSANDGIRAERAGGDRR